MCKQQAILETLLGAAQLQANHLVASRLRQEIGQMRRRREASGYSRLWSAAWVDKRPHSKAA
jgi:hypothetical protein